MSILSLKHKRRYMALIPCILCTTPFATPAFSQPISANEERTSDSSDMIIVTARKRAESIQNVPVAVSAFDEKMLERNAIVSIDQVSQYTPNVVFVPLSISPTAVAPYIRGMGNFGQEPTQDPPIAISVDGVFLAHIAGSLLDVFDAAQVEILRGPQGTLQGRNSPGGAINVITRRPGSEPGARFDASYGNYNDIQLKAAFELPVSDVVSTKFAVMARNSDGHVRNTTLDRRMSGHDSVAGRFGMLLKPVDDLEIYLTADYARDKSKQPGLRYVGSLPDSIPVACTLFGLCDPNPRYTSTADYDRDQDFESWGLTANADYETGPVTLSYVGGYRKVHDIQFNDIDATGMPMFNIEGRDNETKQMSQEVRLSSTSRGPATAGDLDWVVGGFYMDADFTMVQNQRIFDGVLTQAFRSQSLKSYAVFGHASFHITDSLSISAGGRQSWDDKVLLTRPVGSPETGEFAAKFDNLSVEAGAEYQFNPDAMLYARFSQGYRSGGINGQATTLAAVNSYGPEKVNAYEIGLKTQWLDRRLRLNLTAFRADYRALQRNIIILDENNQILSNIENSGKARMQGIEVEADGQPIDNVTIRASYGYLDSKYLDDAFRNFDVIYAPKHTASLGVDIEIPFHAHDANILFSGDVNYKSSFNATTNTLSVGHQSGYALVNGNISYRFNDNRYSIGIYGRNLTNSHYLTTASDTGGLSNWIAEGPRRTYGVRLIAEF